VLPDIHHNRNQSDLANKIRLSPRLLTENEKMKVFTGLKDKRKDLLLQLNKLPMSSNTICSL